MDGQVSPPHNVRVEALEAQAAQLAQQVQALTADIAALRAQRESSPASIEEAPAGDLAADAAEHGHEHAPPGALTRRGLLLGGLASTAAGGAALASAAPAAATTGAMIFGQTNDAGTDRTQLTSTNSQSTLRVANTGTGGDVGHPMHAIQAESNNASGAAVRAIGWNATGVMALSTSPRNLAAGAIYGRGGDNCGVVAISDTGAALRLGNAVLADVPSSGSWTAGDVIMLGNGQLWVCVTSGTPGAWRLLASRQSAGAFVPVTPARVFDSRQQPPTVPLTSGSSRVVSVANAFTPNTNTVTQFNFVPAGATAVSVILTVTAQTAPGYMYLGPGNVVSPAGSSINWSQPTTTIANGLIVALDTARQLRGHLRSNPGATAHFLLDVTGYFLGH